MNVKRRPQKWTLTAATRTMLLLILALALPACLQAQSAGSSSSASSGNASSPSTIAGANFPHGLKLILKDGSFQLVREYQIEGDRVRYYSLDRSQWETIPANMVDWNATKKLAEKDVKSDAALLTKVRRQDEEENPQTLDIDASLEVAPGVFLPPGDHLFVFDGKAVLPLPQAETTSKLSKLHLLGQTMIPIVPSQHSISIQGRHAKLRVRSNQPEFYFRTGNPSAPDIELIRAKIHGKGRHIENIDESFGEQHASADVLPLQRWIVAPGVYRFTLGQRLSPGEYVLAETLPDQGMTLYVWDFGVDSASRPATAEKR